MVDTEREILNLLKCARFQIVFFSFIQTKKKEKTKESSISKHFYVHKALRWHKKLSTYYTTFTRCFWRANTFYTITELTDTALNAQVQGGARQKNLKGSLLPMSATNKGRIKTGHKTMIYVLSLMSAAFAVRPPVRLLVHPLGLSIHPSTKLIVYIGIYNPFFLLWFIIVSSYSLLLPFL